MLSYPFSPSRTLVTIPVGDHRQRWVKQQRYPVDVTLNGASATVAGSSYRLTPKSDGFACSRPGRVVTNGEIYEYGVRNALTTDFFYELAAIRSVIHGKSYPPPLCYEMPNGDIVHPGPCFSAHDSSVIRRTRYNLTEDSDTECSVCHERFV